jgi:hypothetical protein
MFNKLCDLLLRARHWQLFLLLYALPTIGQVAWALSRKEQSLSPGVGAISAADEFLLVCWFWAVGKFLSSISNPSFQLRTRFLEFASIFAVLSNLWLLAWVTYLAPEIDFVMFAVSAVGSICSIYLAYFAAKSLAQVEAGKPLGPKNYWKIFLLFLFYPVGFWVVQPKINRLYAASHQANPPLAAIEA